MAMVLTKPSQIPASHGAATFDGRASLDEQVAEIKKITGGSFARVFDASAHGYDVAIAALSSASTEPVKYFSSVDDWWVSLALIYSIGYLLTRRS